jgi:hypothetical protein
MLDDFKCLKSSLECCACTINLVRPLPEPPTVQQYTSAIQCRSGEIFFIAKNFFWVDDDSGVLAFGSPASRLNFYDDNRHSPLGDEMPLFRHFPSTSLGKGHRDWPAQEGDSG